MLDRPHYVALGDNISIDVFAGGPGHGAASLLYRDDGSRPEFAGRDLRSRIPDLAYLNLARDGAGAAAVSMDQTLPLEDIRGEIRVVTLTVGLNDYIRIWGSELQTGEVAAADFAFHLDEILGDVRRIAGDDALVIVGNIYDPTDGTGDYDAFGTVLWDDGQQILAHFNRTIENVADDNDALVADIHGHFLGHGMSWEDVGHPRHDPDDASNWFIQRVEANDRGASEIRRLFWERVGEMFPPAKAAPTMTRPAGDQA